MMLVGYSSVYLAIWTLSGMIQAEPGLVSSIASFRLSEPDYFHNHYGWFFGKWRDEGDHFYPSDQGSIGDGAGYDFPRLT